MAAVAPTSADTRSAGHRPRPARAEESGFSGVYVAEAWRSGFVPVAAIAARTERVTVGPYVLNAHARTPMIAGLSAVDLDEVAGGRLLLGVGSGNRVTNEKYQGVPVRRTSALSSAR